MIETDKLAPLERIIAPQSKSAQEEALERALRPKRDERMVHTVTACR